ncbi:MAG: biopolymer transporter ExbD [Phycisphaeraceae bacterium]|nr:biopolymer transporter ExbD [Phycisphaerales bacterium]MCB9860955.1 biopolymer transporter ExbD [Phycisphaeraceae bacterium]
MTPMIDVVLQLIIFFMYTAQYTQATRTPMDLPDEPGEEVGDIERNVITIEVMLNGTIMVDQQTITLDTLMQKVQVEITDLGSPESLEILIRAHRDCPSATINAIAVRLAELGVRSWSLGTSDQGGGM